jgi:hypothetical protein
MNIWTVAKHVTSDIAGSLNNSLIMQCDISTVYVSLLLQRVYKITKSDLSSSCLSVCTLKCKSKAYNGRIFMKFYIWGHFPKRVEKNEIALK